MALSAEDLADIRTQIGTTEPPTDAELETLWDRYLSVAKVVEVIIEGRYNQMISQASKWSLDGDMSVDNTESMKRLGSALAGLKTRASGGLPSAVMWRDDVAR